MTITGQSALPKDDIERMVRDAEQFADEDRRRKEEADVRNTADNLLYQTEKLVRDNGDKISAEHKAQLEDAQGKVRTALDGSDIESVRTASDDLMRISQEVGQALYAASAQDQAGAQTTSSTGDDASSADEDIVDAEVIDEGEDDKGAA